MLAACADAALILVFAAIGRDAHQRGDVVIGVFSTAWPFLAGAGLVVMFAGSPAVLDWIGWA